MATTDDFNAAAENDADWFQLQDGSYPAVPRPPHSPDDVIAIRGILPLVVQDTEGFRQNQDVVEAALVILSQSKTARRLAETAIAHNYKVVVANEIESGAGKTSGNRTDGSTDYLNKNINIRSGDDPVALALTIAHEMTHISQMEKGGVPPVVSPYHPLAAIKNILSMEGDARAHEFLVALELAYPDKDDPAERLLFPQAIDAAASSVAGEMGKFVVEHYKPVLQETPRDQLMLRIFKAFYASTDLREHYERTILHSMQTAIDMKPAVLTDEKMFAKDIPTAELLQKLDAHDTAYLQGREKFLDLDGPVARALAPATLEALSALEKKRHENPLTANDPSWTGAPAYAEVAPKPAQQKTAAPKP